MKIKIVIVSLLLVPFFVFAQNQAVLPSAGLTPESPFYFLDKLGEALQRFFTFNPESKARLEITFAKERIAEIKVILEDRGVSAKGLGIAEEGLSDNLSRATAILANQKQGGKDTSNLAKDLLDAFYPAREELKNTLKSGVDTLDAEIDELKAKLKDARLADDTAQIETLTKEIADLKTQKELLEQHGNKDNADIEEENEHFDEALGLQKEATEKIKDAEEEKADLLKEAQEDNLTLPDGAFKEFDTLLSQAKAAFDAGNYEDAKRLAKEAKKNLKEAEKHFENLKDTRDEEKEKAESADDIQGVGISGDSTAPKPTTRPLVFNKKQERALACYQRYVKFQMPVGFDIAVTAPPLAKPQPCPPELQLIPPTTWGKVYAEGAKILLWLESVEAQDYTWDDFIADVSEGKGGDYGGKIVTLNGDRWYYTATMPAKFRDLGETYRTFKDGVKVTVTTDLDISEQTNRAEIQAFRAAFKTMTQGMKLVPPTPPAPVSLSPLAQSLQGVWQSNQSLPFDPVLLESSPATGGWDNSFPLITRNYMAFKGNRVCTFIQEENPSQCYGPYTTFTDSDNNLTTKSGDHWSDIVVAGDRLEYVENRGPEYTTRKIKNIYLKTSLTAPVDK